MYKYKLNERAFDQPQDVLVFQEKRIAAFKDIEARINALYPLLDNAKDETIAYYEDKPASFAVVTPTDLILDYIKDIEKLLTNK
jgi:hypothetical protein